MRRAFLLVVGLVVIASFSLISVFVPVVHETYFIANCYPHCEAFPTLRFNYTASISYHLFHIGAVNGVCGGYQVFVREVPEGVQSPADGEPLCIDFWSPH